MNPGIFAGSIIRIPLQVHYKGKDHNGEVIGKATPAIKYFTCRFPGSDMLIIEAIAHREAQSYTWVTCTGHEFDYLVPFIGQEIEKYLNER